MPTTSATTLGQTARLYYSETDAEGGPALLRWFTPDCRLRFNNNDVIHGREAVTAFIVGRRHSIQRVHHRVEYIAADEETDTVALEITVEYLTVRGREIEVRGSAFLTFVGGRVDFQRVYVDARPLAAALEGEL